MTPRTFKTSLSLALAVVIVCLPAPATAKPWDVSLTGGVGIPSGDFKKDGGFDAESGGQVGVDICVDLSETFALGADASWNRNSHKNEGATVDLGGGITETANKDRYQTLQFGAHGKYKLSTSGSIKPYALVGLGIYSVKEDYEYTQEGGVMTEVFTDESDEAAGYFEQPGSRFGYKVGVGATYMTSPTIGIGLGVDYNSISMDKDKFGVSTLPYISIRGRITYHIMAQ